MKNSKGLVRTGSVAALIAVPALAVAFLGSDLLAGLSLPNCQISETRDFNYNGQNLAAPANATTDSVDVFLGNWQNTVRTPPSPRI
jgi:hypothetical protein